jgi:hypothetical protein
MDYDLAITTSTGGYKEKVDYAFLLRFFSKIALILVAELRAPLQKSAVLRNLAPVLSICPAIWDLGD